MEVEPKPDHVLLNALVDGELSPAERAAAAARLSTDREFARAYATLSQLKASVAEIAADNDAPLISPAPPFQRSWLGPATALAVLTAVLVYVAVSLLQQERREVGPGTSTVAISFAGDPVIPDLSPAGLRLARTIMRTGTGTSALVATYLGPRGCRLELWVSSGGHAPASPAGTGNRRWHVNDLAYELIAFGMVESRFEQVAAMAEQATRAPSLPEATDAPLVIARVPTPPCIG